MTREFAKQILPVIKAYSEGKDIEYRSDVHEEWDVIENPEFDDEPCCYRVKKEKVLKPYTYEEMCEAVKKHGTMVKNFGNKSCWTITGFTENIVMFYSKDEEPFTYKELLETNVWLDDNSPCGSLKDE